MASSIANKAVAPHRVIPEMRPKMASSDLRKPESRDFQAEIGACLFRARSWLGWTLEELAGHLPPPTGSDKRDPRQVRRWEEGSERVQVDVVFAVPELREPFVVQLAKVAGSRVGIYAEFAA